MRRFTSLDGVWVGEEHDGDTCRSEDHVWERDKVGARHVQQSAGRDGAPDEKKGAAHNCLSEIGRQAAVPLD